MSKLFFKLPLIALFIFLFAMLLSSCSTQRKTIAGEKKRTVEKMEAGVVNPNHPTEGIENKVEIKSPVTIKTIKEWGSRNEFMPRITSNDSLISENKYERMLRPVAEFKNTMPELYWFIVSWLNTNYGAMNNEKWGNYESSQWHSEIKNAGIDCSGFARVMEDKIFKKKIRGGSCDIFTACCTPVQINSLVIGDLVFFCDKSKNSKDKAKIVHVGVYLKDKYFVHATSYSSAKTGKGLNISSLDEEEWKRDFEIGGRITQK